VVVGETAEPKAAKNPKNPPPVDPPKATVPPPNGEDGKGEPTTSEDGDVSELETKITALKTMNGKALRKIADELKLTYEEKADVDVLRELIAKAYNGEPTTGEDGE
jgi:hypothetical protein